MKVLIDTNIILDIALARMPFLVNSKLIIEQLSKSDFIGYVTATTITDIYYIIKKQKGDRFAKTMLISLLKIINILGIDQKVIYSALESEINDFEDAVQSIAA